MRIVKCKVTGEKGYDYNFFKAPDGRYYKTKSVYLDSMIKKEYQVKILSYINGSLLAKPSHNCVSYIYKHINESGINIKTLYEKIVAKTDYLISILATSKASDLGKINLIFSLVLKSEDKPAYAGCYEIRNKRTNKVYIGESIDIFTRFTAHIAELYLGHHHCQSLQDEFNQDKTIDSYIVRPLFIYPIVSCDKKELKHETLYLESAFYLIAKQKMENLHNTLNPYTELKSNKVSLKDFEVDCNKVLEMLCEDKYCVLPDDIKKSIRSDLGYKVVDTNNVQDDTQEDTERKKNTLSIKNKGNETLKENTTLYRISDILKEFAVSGILPQNYNYSKIRNVLVQNNLVFIDEFNHTVATDYALENNLYVISNTSQRENCVVYNYYLTEKCKTLLYNIFSKYEDVSCFENTS